ncbi:MAG TPA: hypothetical protein VLK59_02065 [Solirubrobacteraceae bacterium]|nr:hypothetical protein [Solirubrobacteraceae bacterium]
MRNDQPFNGCFLPFAALGKPSPDETFDLARLRYAQQADGDAIDDDAGDERGPDGDDLRDSTPATSTRWAPIAAVSTSAGSRPPPKPPTVL